MNQYEIGTQRDRDKIESGLFEFVRKRFICKRLKKLEPKCSEVICVEFTISNKKWICFSVYKPPTQNDLDCFFNKLTTSLSQTSEMYDSFMVTGNLNFEKHGKLEKCCNFIVSYFRFNKIRLLSHKNKQP